MTPQQRREAIVNHMAARGITRYQLSKRTEIGQGHLSDILSGAGCTEDTLQRICDALGLEMVVRAATEDAE